MGFKECPACPSSGSPYLVPSKFLLLVFCLPGFGSFLSPAPPWVFLHPLSSQLCLAQFLPALFPHPVSAPLALSSNSA